MGLFSSLAPPRATMVAKNKKKSSENIGARLALVTKSGKYSLGYRSTLKSLRKGRAKLIIISANCPPIRKSEIEYYASLSRTTVYHYGGNNVDWVPPAVSTTVPRCW